jgi:hypothetical protein
MSVCGFLQLYWLLGWRTSLQRLKVAAHVVKLWFSAPSLHLSMLRQESEKSIENMAKKVFRMHLNV